MKILENPAVKNILMIDVIVLIFAIDQLSKWSIIEYVIKPGLFGDAKEAVTPFFSWLFQSADRLPFFTTEITSWLNVVMVWNQGVSFGLFNTETQYGPLILTIITGTIAIGFFMWMIVSKSCTQKFALALVIGGAIGNIVDRLRFEAVIDFIDIHAFGYHWPAFNVADSTIVIGVVLLMLHTMITGEAEKPE
jgi:signal peptidase II